MGKGLIQIGKLRKESLKKEMTEVEKKRKERTIVRCGGRETCGKEADDILGERMVEGPGSQGDREG